MDLYHNGAGLRREDSKATTDAASIRDQTLFLLLCNRVSRSTTYISLLVSLDRCLFRPGVILTMFFAFLLMWTGPSLDDPCGTEDGSRYGYL